MKANELMIGDWVKLSKGNWSENRQVQLIDIEMIAESVYFAEPIPLTAEILEKNGFGYKSLGGAEEWFIEDDYYDIVVHEWSDSIWVFRYDCTEMNTPHEQRTFSYVNNLQRALKECGIDKEIVL